MRQRRGFTLIELLVAMALTLFVMVILSEAFGTGLTVFRDLKAMGDMEENLRTASTLVRADLAADHFEGKRRPSDLNFYTDRPTQGFLRIVRNPAGVVNEGNDADGIPSFISGTHVLHMTVKRRGNRREDFFAAVVPAGSPLLSANTTFFNQPLDARVQDTANTFSSQWAEVAYFLVRTGSTVEPANPASASGTPLYALYRTELVVVPNTTDVNPPGALAVPAAQVAGYGKISCRLPPGSNNVLFNNPADLQVVDNRSFNPAAPDSRGATLVLSSVVSFQVRVLRYFRPAPNLAEFFDPDFGDVDFDSATATTAEPGLPAQTSYIRSVAVTLRVWDQKTQQTRQVTLVQDM